MFLSESLGQFPGTVHLPLVHQQLLYSTSQVNIDYQMRSCFLWLLMAATFIYAFIVLILVDVSSLKRRVPYMSLFSALHHPQHILLHVLDLYIWRHKRHHLLIDFRMECAFLLAFRLLLQFLFSFWQFGQTKQLLELVVLSTYM